MTAITRFQMIQILWFNFAIYWQ